jgi:aspartyl-tRNA(Asn)/glutamyl-tRNA(Gln) amidotransferase subunit A
VITLKEALKLSAEEIAALRDDLKAKIEADPELNAYVGMDTCGEGVPIAIKDNIR